MEEALRQDAVKEGIELPILEFGPITTEDLVRWAGASGDYNPIHYDQKFAESQGLPDVIMHGPFKLSLACSMLMNWLGSNGYIRRINTRYTGMDVPGNNLTFGGTVLSVAKENGARVVEVELKGVNQKGENIIKGEATVVLKD